MTKNESAPANRSFYALLLIVPLTFSGTFWAAAPALASAGPALTTLLRFAIATLVLWPVLWLFRRDKFIPIDRPLLSFIFLSSTTGGVGYHLIFFAGAGRIDPARAAILIALTPAIIAILEATLLGRSLGKHFGIGMTIGLSGVLMVLTAGQDLSLLTTSWSLGDSLIVVASLCWAIYSIWTQRVKKPQWDSHWMGLWFATGTSVFSLLLCISELPRVLDYSFQEWLPHLYLGIFPTALGYTLYSIGIARLGAGRSALYIFLVPILTALSRPLFTDQGILFTDLLGSALVFLGMSLALRPVKPAT